MRTCRWKDLTLMPPTGEADRKLFLSILRDQNVKVDSKAVATALSTGTTHCTPRAVEERLKKLKKMALEVTSW